jgi:hypothetical protein
MLESINDKILIIESKQFSWQKKFWPDYIKIKLQALKSHHYKQHAPLESINYICKVYSWLHTNLQHKIYCSGTHLLNGALTVLLLILTRLGLTRLSMPSRPCCRSINFCQFSCRKSFSTMTPQTKLNNFNVDQLRTHNH